VNWKLCSQGMRTYVFILGGGSAHRIVVVESRVWSNFKGQVLYQRRTIEKLVETKDALHACGFEQRQASATFCVRSPHERKIAHSKERLRERRGLSVPTDF
jgi:hypothetical protein